MESVVWKKQKDLPKDDSNRAIFWELVQIFVSSRSSINKPFCNYGVTQMFANWESFL